MDIVVMTSLVVAAMAMLFTAHQSFLWRRDSADRRRMEQVTFLRSFEDDLAGITDALHGVVGGPEDGIDPALRRVVVRLLVIYSQVYVASREELFVAASWEGLRHELRYWLSRPRALAAWRTLRRQHAYWPDGFVEFVDDELRLGGIRPDERASVTAPAGPAGDDDATR